MPRCNAKHDEGSFRPDYFDFISFAQYALINDKIKNAKVEFVEKFNAEGDTRVVRREVTDALLVPTHSAKVGDIVLDYIIETYAQNGLVPKEVGKKKRNKPKFHRNHCHPHWWLPADRCSGKCGKSNWWRD